MAIFTMCPVGLITTITILLITSPAVQGDDCYFPIEYQGSFLMQTQATINEETGGNSVTYSEITVESDSIPPWGRCFKRRGNHVMLKDSSGPQDCIRCFHLVLQTPNILQIHAEGLGRCYTNEAAARSRCPTEKDVKDKNVLFKEMMLFRKHIPGGLQSIDHRFCPFNGRYRLSYLSLNKQLRCDSPHNELGNCPHGDKVSIKFRGCSFTNMDLNFICLGDWGHPGSTGHQGSSSSPNGERFVALMDLREVPDSVPKYRCGLYREESSTGRIYLSLSSDSTCVNQLRSSNNGFESMILSPVSGQVTSLMAAPMPSGQVATCSFPEWTQGEWQSVKVTSSWFIFKDEVNQFQTLTSRCLNRQVQSPNDRFIIHSTSQCGESSYRCVWFKRRSPNILEFQFGQEIVSTFSDQLCDDKQFTTNNWITQGRKSILSATPCPITGDYSGPIPGSSGLCAKVASDCNNPDIMFYSVWACDNRSHVFEEREYRCLGNWEEDSILYTFTQRRDMAGHQCFAGKIFRSGEEVFIKEAGESCIRGEDPLLFGMNITKEAPCPRVNPIRTNRPISISSSNSNNNNNHNNNMNGKDHHLINKMRESAMNGSTHHGRGIVFSKPSSSSSIPSLSPSSPLLPSSALNPVSKGSSTFGSGVSPDFAHNSIIGRNPQVSPSSSSSSDSLPSQSSSSSPSSPSSTPDVSSTSMNILHQMEQNQVMKQEPSLSGLEISTRSRDPYWYQAESPAIMSTLGHQGPSGGHGSSMGSKSWKSFSSRPFYPSMSQSHLSSSSFPSSPAASSAPSSPAQSQVVTMAIMSLTTTLWVTCSCLM